MLPASELLLPESQDRRFHCTGRFREDQFVEFMKIYEPLLPDEKIQVFISSLCGDDYKDDGNGRRKYVLVRRELQALLESTGLFCVYNFDTRGASSQSTRDQYLSRLGASDLVVFLIDNEDSISEGVRKEETRAIELNKKRYYLFCNQGCQTKTDIQLRLEKSADGEPRFEEVNKFVELGERAFASIIEDLLEHYKLPDELQKRIEEDRNKANEAKLNPGAISTNELTDSLKGIRNQENSYVDAMVKSYISDSIGKQNIGKENEKANESNLECKNITNHTIDKKNFSESDDNSEKNKWFVLNRKLYEAPKELGFFLFDTLVRGKIQVYETEAANKTRITSESRNAIKLLAAFIGKAKFDPYSFDNLAKSIIERQNEAIKPILKERLSAIKSYKLGQISDALTHIRNAFNISCDLETSTIWFKNDIAIDLRNIISLKGKADGDFKIEFELNNEGQKILDASEETVYYPILDRSVTEFQEGVINQYEKNFLQSPYTISFGNSIDQVFKHIASSFWIALMNGSFTQLEVTNERLITALQMIVNTYDDHIPAVELIRLILIRNYKIRDNIGNILRTYHSDTDLLNDDEADSIYESIEWMPVEVQREQAEYYFFAYFSCYCSETLFDTETPSLIERTMEWAKNPERSFWNSEDKYRFYDGLTERDHPEKFIEFVLAVFDTSGMDGGSSGFKRDFCKHLSGIDFSIIEEPLVDKLLACFLPNYRLRMNPSTRYENVPEAEQTLSENIYQDNPSLIDFMTQVALSCPPKQHEIRDCLIGSPQGIIEHYDLNVDVSNYKNNSSIDLYRFIKGYLKSAEISAESAQNGTIAESGVNYYGIIRYILENTKLALTEEQIAEIVQYSLEFMSVKLVRVPQRVTCCQVIALLYKNYKGCFDSKALSKRLVEDREKNTAAERDFFFRDSPLQLQLAYLLMLIATGHGSVDELTNLLSLIGNDDYVKIQCLNILTEALAIDSDNKLRKASVIAISNFVLMSSNTRERDVKFGCVKCLIELSKYSYVKEIVLSHLVLFMNGSNPQIRLATVARIKKSNLDKDEVYVKAILDKAKVDHNYLVRKQVL